MRMPFGKFKGYPVSELPREYLEWLQSNVDLRGRLASAVAEALGESEDGALYPATDLPPELKPVVHEIVSVGYRMLALKVHPDQGGDHKDMTKLNRAKDWLRKIAA